LRRAAADAAAGHAARAGTLRGAERAFTGDVAARAGTLRGAERSAARDVAARTGTLLLEATAVRDVAAGARAL